MLFFNAPDEVKELLSPVCFTESFSDVSVEHCSDELCLKPPFCAFLNDSELLFSMFKMFSKSRIVLFDSNAKLLIQLIGKGVLPDSLLLVGVQDFSRDEFVLLRKYGIKFYSMREISFDGIADVCDAVMSVLNSSAHFHLHVEESVLDSAGFSGRELLYFFHRLRLLKGVKSVSLRMQNDFKLQSKLAVELF